MGLLAVMFQHFVLYRGMSDMLDFILTAAFSFTHSCAEIRNDVNLFFKGHKFIDSAHLFSSTLLTYYSHLSDALVAGTGCVHQQWTSEHLFTDLIETRQLSRVKIEIIALINH